jgi:hypothetical protein
MGKVLIVSFSDVGIEAQALRQALEIYGFSILLKYIGRPNDFIDVLKDNVELNADYIIISCHGEDGRIMMPKLHESIYLQDEPKHDFSSNEIEKYLELSNKIIISTGCTTGYNNIMDVFSKNNNTYIAPTDYVDGNTVFIFVANMFYFLSKKIDIFTSFNKAKQLNNDTSCMIISLK